MEGRSRSWLGPDPLPTSLERTPTLLRCLFLKRRHASGACECRGPTPGPRFGRSVVVESGAPASASSCSRVLGHRARSLSFACSSEPSPNALTVGGAGDSTLDEVSQLQPLVAAGSFPSLSVWWALQARRHATTSSRDPSQFHMSSGIMDFAIHERVFVGPDLPADLSGHGGSPAWRPLRICSG